MARPFMFAALCQRAHPLKHSLAESHIRQPSPKNSEEIFVSRKTAKKSSLAEKFVSTVTRQPRYHCIFLMFNCACVVKLLAGQTEQTWHSLACAVKTEDKTVRVWGVPKRLIASKFIVSQTGIVLRLKSQVLLLILKVI